MESGRIPGGREEIVVIFRARPAGFKTDRHGGEGWKTLTLTVGPFDRSIGGKPRALGAHLTASTKYSKVGGTFTHRARLPARFGADRSRAFSGLGELER